jgi:tetratricopeptide (TPR) repeat protein
MNKDQTQLQNAFALHQQGKLVEAANIYEQLIKRDPNNQDALHFFGILKTSCGQLVEGRQLIERSLARRVTNVSYVENYVSILFQIGDYEQAAKACTKAINENRKTETFQYVLAISLHKLGRLTEADAAFNSLLLSYPKHLAGNNERASTLAELQRYEEALSYVERALKINPEYAEAFLNKGNILAKLQKYDDAILAYKRTLSFRTRLFDAYLGCGNVFRELRRFDEAIAAYDKALALKPDFAEAWLGRGNVFTELKRFDEANVAYDKALVLKPDLPGAWLGRGNVFTDLRRFDEAMAAYDKTLALKPDLPGAWLGLGKVFTELKRFAEALAAYDKALTIKPDLTEIWLGRGNVLRELQQSDEAFTAYDKALALKPDLAGGWLGRGNVFADLRRFDEAMAAYDKALALKPDLAETWLGRGSVFVGLKRFDEAMAAYDKALALKPDLADAWIGRGNVFSELKRDDNACAAYDRATGLEPDRADAYWNKSLVKLCRGEFEEGWDLYEWRWQSKDYIAAYADLKSLQTCVRQDRNVFVGKKVAILSEQGVGDEIMFASILPDLIADAKTIYYEADPRLTRLFEDAFPGVTFVPRGGNRNYLREQVFDVVLQTGSLGYAYRRDARLFPRVPYLSADPIRIDKWKAILAKEAGSRLKIGISWRGGTDKTRRDDRSIDLEQLAPLIGKDERYFVSLQYGNVGNELARFNNAGAGTAVHCLLDDFNNFDDFAALIMALDLVISVQNTTIHTCGALGKTCWGMIPSRPEWRYGTNDHEMIWYSSIALYRQKSAGEWAGVISSINSELTRLSASQIK